MKKQTSKNVATKSARPVVKVRSRIDHLPARLTARKRTAKAKPVCPKCGRENNRLPGVDPICRVASACKARRRAA